MPGMCVFVDRRWSCVCVFQDSQVACVSVCGLKPGFHRYNCGISVSAQYYI